MIATNWGRGLGVGGFKVKAALCFRAPAPKLFGCARSFCSLQLLPSAFNLSPPPLLSACFPLSAPRGTQKVTPRLTCIYNAFISGGPPEERRAASAPWHGGQCGCCAAELAGLHTHSRVNLGPLPVLPLHCLTETLFIHFYFVNR